MLFAVLVGRPQDVKSGSMAVLHLSPNENSVRPTRFGLADQSFQ